MSLIIEKGHFDGLSGALEDIKGKGLFPTTYATDHATAADLHWHSEEVLAYLIQGKMHFLDADGQEYRLTGLRTARSPVWSQPSSSIAAAVASAIL